MWRGGGDEYRQDAGLVEGHSCHPIVITFRLSSLSGRGGIDFRTVSFDVLLFNINAGSCFYDSSVQFGRILSNKVIIVSTVFLF